MLHHRILPILTITSVAAPVAFGQIDAPESLGPGGGSTRSVVVSPVNGEILVKTIGVYEPGGVTPQEGLSNLLRSTDDGDTFLPDAGSDQLSDLLQDPVDPTRIYGLRHVDASPDYEELATSADFGDTWTSLSPAGISNHRYWVSGDGTSSPSG